MDIRLLIPALALCLSPCPLAARSDEPCGFSNNATATLRRPAWKKVRFSLAPGTIVMQQINLP